MQKGWRWCRKCQGLAFSGHGNGVCAADGFAHNFSQSGAYALWLGDSEANGQSNWRWCRKCQGLGFAGHNYGICPSGGTHDYSGSGDYVLSTGEQTRRSQADWRWCQKCQGLAFGGHGPGHCPAGGVHDHKASGNYTLFFEDSPISDNSDQKSGLTFPTGDMNVGLVPRPRYLNVGFNYPWAWDSFGIYFGGGVPPGSNPGMDMWISNLRTNLSYLKSVLNIWHVRIFLLCNAHNYGTTVITPPPPHTGSWRLPAAKFDQFTPPKFLHSKFIDHLGYMLDAFQREKMFVVPSLIAHGAFHTNIISGRGHGGRADLVNDPAKRDIFFNQVLDPFLDLSRSFNESIYAWEVNNEPIFNTSWAHACFQVEQLLSQEDTPKANMVTFIQKALERIEKIPEFKNKSTVGHRFFNDLGQFPTGKLRQFHYYPKPIDEINSRLKSLPSVKLPHTDPPKIPPFSESNAFIGEFSCEFSGGIGGPWPELNGADTKKVSTAAYERLRLLNAKGYGLAFVWPDLPDPKFGAPDPVRLSKDAQSGIKRFTESDLV